MNIDRDIPVPPRRNVKYPFAELAVGESFAVALSGELASNGIPLERNRLGAAACLYGRRHGTSYTIRLADGYVRCWRIK